MHQFRHGKAKLAQFRCWYGEIFWWCTVLFVFKNNATIMIASAGKYYCQLSAFAPSGLFAFLLRTCTFFVLFALFFYSFTLKRLPCFAFIRKHFIYIFLRLHASDRVEAMALFRIWLLVITILVVVAYKINSLGKLNSWPFLCYNKHIIKRPLVCRAGTISFKAFEYLALRKFQRFPYYFIF